MTTQTTPFERQRAPWARTTGLTAVLDQLRQDPQVSSLRTSPARAPQHVSIPEALHPNVARALRERGIDELYTHQADAFEHALQGRDVVIATPTSSGKSLCYNLPVLDAFARDPEARALYLFPTKALSRDQESAFRSLMTGAGIESGAITYDGDTPGDARRAARERSGVILTNPDMLHSGILPHHASWSRMFANLKFVVIDELHSYRGVFGSHLANVVRRLRRVAQFHGSNPTFLLASATIGNPSEHASNLIGRDVELVRESGAPAGTRHYAVYNPPVLNPELGIRASYLKTTVRLVRDLLEAKVTTLVFGQSRNSVEVMFKYLRDALVGAGMDPQIVHAYRGGYLPDTRRRIEQQLRDGELQCVVATNALELGIDVGSLDAVVCAGYPGSAAALMQRYGRAGRRQNESLALLVASSAPLDQYVALDGKGVLDAPIEEARIDPDNTEILVQHMKCASFEIPFAEGESFGTCPAGMTDEVLGFLTTNRVLHETTGRDGRRRWHWANDAYPANHVSLRSVGWDNYVIIDLDDNRTMGEMDWRGTHTMLHEQAIYQHEGEQYQVEKLDYENHKAFVRKVEPDYYTDAMKHTRISVVEALDESHHDGLTFSSGEIGIVEKVVGYKKIKFHSHENVGYGDVHLPEMEMQTRAMWFTLDESLVTSFGSPRVELMDALRGAANALHTVACVGLMIDPRDLGRHVREQPEGAESRGTDARLEPTVFLYDQVPGGVGLAVRLYEQRVGLFERAISLAEGCACAAGCPACVGPSVGMSNLNPASPTDTIRSSLRRGRAASVLRALSERASAGAAA